MASLTVLVVIASVFAQTFAFRIIPRLDGRIVGGEGANIKDFPYQLSFQYRNSHICGASIIGESVALTAAHCTAEKTASLVSVRAGSNFHVSGGEVIVVSKIDQHPKYNSIQTDYDVAVLHLVASFTKGSPVSLQPIGAEVAVGALAVITGWGTTSEGGSLPISLKKVELAHITDDECRVAYGDILTERMTCYTSPGKDSCQGDSGGPLVYKNEQVGIVSWGYGCARPAYPGVYAKVSDSNIHNYITESMANK